MPTYLKQISEKVSPQEVGNKGFLLCKLNAYGFPVPATIFLTSQAFTEFLRFNAFSKETFHPLDEQIQTWQQHILNGKMPASLAEEIALACRRFQESGVQKLAVRSSGLLEDAKNHSFAGQYRTVLNVDCAPASVEQAVKNVWASLWNREALSYYRENKIDFQKTAMAVVLQEMVQPDWAGVAFSVNPVSGDPQELVLEYVAGQGEKLVGGEQTPVQITIHQESGALKTNTGQPIPDILKDLTAQIISIEKKFGYAVDVEWAVRDGAVYFLQARPITTHVLSARQPELWTDENVGEVIPDIVTPFSWSILDPVTNEGFRWFLKKIALNLPNGVKLFDTYKGKVYFNRTAFEQLLQRFYIRQSLKQFGKTRGVIGKVPVLPQLIQLIRSFFAILALNVSLPRRIVKHLETAEPELADLRWRSEQDDAHRLQKMQAIIDYQKRTMALHISGTIFAEVFYQLLKKITEQWIQPLRNFQVDDFLSGTSGLVSAQNARALWQIARMIKRYPTTLEALRQSDDVGEIENLLAQDAHGKIILSKLDEYFTRHGHGALHEFELYYPRWWEDKAYTYLVLKSYVQMDDKEDPLAKHDKISAIREEKIRNVRQVLPIFERKVFDYLLKKTQFYARQREELKQLLLKTHSELKKYLNSLGRKWVEQGRLKKSEDIFFFNWLEIEKILSGDPLTEEYAQRIRKRKQERVGFERAFHPKQMRRIGDRWLPVNDDREKTATGLTGIGCSAGFAQGSAKVILSPEEFNRMQQGDILITRSTNPGWAPLFLLAGGIVTEIGGALSHAAIIAREYGIPMVAAVPDACTKIKTGQSVRIDGNAGLVELLTK